MAISSKVGALVDDEHFMAAISQRTRDYGTAESCAYNAKDQRHV
jgi:hypothetical protein